MAERINILQVKNALGSRYYKQEDDETLTEVEIHIQVEDQTGSNKLAHRNIFNSEDSDAGN